MARRLAIAAMLPLLLTGCLFGGGDDAPRVAAPQPSRPEPAGPVAFPARPTAETLQCEAELDDARVEYRPLEDRDYGGGCLVTGSVQLLNIGVPVTGLKAMRCGLAKTFAAWVRYGVAPAAQQILGSSLVRVETFGTFACRGIVGNGAEAAKKLSEHGLANAVDVSAFVLADGRRVTIEQDWRSGDSAVRAFLQTIHRSACRRFQTVLSPDYNAAHHNHLHFDMGRGPFCR